MKQCPACKTNYADDSLAFCLNDGTHLVSMPDPQATQKMSFDKNQIRVEIPSNPSNPSTPTVFSIPRQTVETKKSGNGLTMALLAVCLLLFLAVAGIGAYIFINKGGFGKTDVVISNSTSPSPTPIVSPTKSQDNTQELKDRLAKLEKQLNDQKNANISQTPPPPPTPPNQTTVTARVAPASDGFLALRNAPSAQNGSQVVKIPTGATVEVQDCQRVYVTIDGRRGRWCMVSYAGQTGWAFDAWLIY